MAESAQKDSIIVKTHDLLKEMIGVVKRFPRDQKFLLGDRLQTTVTDVLELLIEAYYLPGAQKRHKLERVNMQLEKLRHYLRLSYELGFYNSIRLGQLQERVQEIGRMNGGWLKSLGAAG